MVAPSQTYDLAAARQSLDVLYSYRDISFFHGVSLHQALAHVQAVDAHFTSLYPGVSPHAFYDRILPRANALPGFLASLDSDRAPAHQARLVFERQALHVVETRDFLLTQLRIRQGHLQQGINSRLQKQTSELRGKRLEGIQTTLRGELSRSEGPQREVLEKLAVAPLHEPDQARALLRLEKAHDHQTVREGLAALTRHFDPEEISPHGERATLLLELARGKRSWDTLTEKERTCLGKNRRLLSIVEPASQVSLLSILLTERLLEAMARGKLTVARSWEYQDLGKLVEGVPLPSSTEEWPLPPKTLEALLDGSYPLDLTPLHEVGSRPPPPEEDEVAELERSDFTPAMREAMSEVRARNPDWFPRLRQVLDEQWQGMFRMELTDDEFSGRLLQAIGYVGRNCRVSLDSNRHLTDR